jgi:immune inhibitor A
MESNLGRCPPSPELVNKILNTKAALVAGESIPKEATVDFLDLETFTLISTRPASTRAHTLTESPSELAPVVGNRRALVLLVDFSDKVAKETQKHYMDMLFSKGTYQTGSLRDFYWEASYQKLDVTGDVSGQGGATAGWYRAPKPYSYYTNNQNGFGQYPQNAQKLVEDVVALAASSINYANYDNDGDGVVDALFVVHAGPGAEATGNKADIWSHQWSINPKTYNGVKVSNYSMEPEDGRIGVFCHELGHVFGLPDLYDYGYDSAGTGSWDLMAGGSWNNGGLNPAHPIGWCKAKLGWLNPTKIFNAQQVVTLKPYAKNDQIFKLPINDINSKEYFLMENRKKTGFDTYLPGDGLIITHIDENMANNNDQNHYLVDIEQCDGKFDLNKNANRGDDKDPYPCGTNTALTISTTPNSKSYAVTDSKVSVTDIQKSGENITATVNVGGVSVAAWHNNIKVTSTFAYYTSQWAWANIEGVGWRRIKDGSADGVTNIFELCCEAVANTRPVNAYVDSNFIYTMYLL